MKRTVEFTVNIDVEIDEAKFTDEFMKEFSESFYKFKKLEYHIEHLAYQELAGLVTGHANQFIEGYGPIDRMGIKISDLECIYTHVQEHQDA